METLKPRHLIALAIALFSSIAFTAAPAASAEAAPRAADICAKRAKEATRGLAMTSSVRSSRHRAAHRHCMVRLARTSARRRTTTADTTAPTVGWQLPVAGATVSGKLQGSSCVVSAGDERGVDRVVFRVDGSALNTEDDAPYNCIFDTTRVANGSHTLTATAYDAAGNSRSASLAINVSNTSTSTSTPSPAPTPTADTTPPTVSWQTPAAGATVSGKLQGSSCVVSAGDERGVDRVVFRVDGSALNTEDDAPYNCIFDTTRVANGSHTLTATAYDAAGNSRSASLAINVSNGPAPAPAPSPEPSPAPSPTPTPGTGRLEIGMDGHFAGWPSDEIADRAALGAPVTRHMWELDNPVSAEEQQVIAGATTVKTRMHALLGGNQLGDAAHLREFTVAFVRYWGPGGTFWDKHPELDESRYAITSIELGNEPYFGEMSETLYADTVRPTLEAVAQLGVPVKVVLPSFIHGQDTSWIDTLYARIPNLNSLYYAIADHPYWYGHDPADEGNNGPFERIDTLRQTMNRHGASAKPIFLTEYGESTASCGSECVSEATQAAHLKSMIDTVVARTDWKVEMLTFYTLRDRGTNSSDREEQFGILRQNGTQKPAYSILRSAMQQYRG